MYASYYNTGYISATEPNNRLMQNLEPQIDPLRNILCRCKYNKSAVDNEEILTIPTANNNWTSNTQNKNIKDFTLLNWNPAFGWANGCSSPTLPDVKENFETNSKTISLSELPEKNPVDFGPKLWYCLHNAAKSYPENPTKLVIHRMKNFILGIPYIIPCESCYDHALEYILNNEKNLDEICKNKKNLVIFFIEFHNNVNKRIGKQIYKIID